MSPGRVIETRILQAYDWYYLDKRRRLPLPVLLVVMDDPGHSRAYVDPSTGRVVGQYSDGNWMSRWLYEGLHSWNAPWLYAHRPLWDLLVIGFMAGGAALAITSIRLALGVVGGRWTRHGRSSVDGDAPGVTVR
jgi:hypothetical protein